MLSYPQRLNVSATYAKIPAPYIYGINDELLQLNTGGCYAYPGADPYPTSVFGINFSYDDPDGDVDKSDGAKLNVGWDNTPWSTFTVNGYIGSIQTRVCFNFDGDSGRTFTVYLQDAAGNRSNSRTITIDRPPRAN